MRSPWILKKFLRRRPAADSMPHSSGYGFNSPDGATEITLRNLAFDDEVISSDDRNDSNSLQRTNNERQTISNNVATMKVVAEPRTIHLKWPSCEDEDYIVFTLRGDGEVIEISKQRERSVSPKKDEVEEDNTQLQPETESSRGSITRMQHQVVENEACNIGSNQFPESESSTSTAGSFAFPTLNWDWMGTPVQMPKAEDGHLKKHKTPCVRLTCWRQ